MPPRGRRPTMLELNEDLVAIAVDIHPRQATLASIDLKGRLLSREELPLSSDPVVSVQRLLETMERMRQAQQDKHVQGIGISLPGRVDSESRRLIFAPNLHWPEFDLKHEIETKLGLPVAMENAATASLLAELTFRRLDGIRDIVLVTISEGVGTGIYSGGHFISGSRGMAGEFGHVSLDPAGLLCACGQRGCWETLASCRAAVRFFNEQNPSAPISGYNDLLHLAEEGDSHAVAALERQARAIGSGLRMIVYGLAPSLILIAGHVTSAWSRIGPLIEQEVRQFAPGGIAPQIQPTHEGEIARLRGAAALVFQQSGLRGENAEAGA